MTAPSTDLIPLERLRIANPCPARWEELEGDDRIRFCGACKKNVYNLSALQRSEAEALVARHEGKICATFFRRTDGTVLTADCPVGRRRVRSRLFRRVAMVAAAVFGFFGGQYFTARPKSLESSAEVESRASRDLTGVHPRLQRQVSDEELEKLRLLGSLSYIDIDPAPAPADRNCPEKTLHPNRIVP